MKVSVLKYAESEWQGEQTPADEANNRLVISFFSPNMPEPHRAWARLNEAFGDCVVGCSTSGEIVDQDVEEDTAVAMCIDLERTRTRIERVAIENDASSYVAGTELGQKLSAPDLACIFLLADGLNVNGTQLVAGLRGVVGNDLAITGGLAGDDDRFEKTFVGACENYTEKQIVAVGFYGENFECSSGSYAGWDVFGPTRTITKAEGNVLYELDGQPALTLYKKYLGDEAEKLPGSGLLFPLKVFPSGAPEHDVIRTIIGIDEETGSMTFAGEMTEGHQAQLMTGNFDRLIEAAGQSVSQLQVPEQDAFAVMVSCVGRKLLLGQRCYEEVEEAAGKLNSIPAIGFYSYGEVARHHKSGVCELHNQTMTVAVFSEK
ncbi:MAG: FIST C-terminal domain-containing protein [Aquisalinus sp.]|nr:FIST C-terminal domain-containing protein [Aquisalinus sp.]